MTPLEQAGDVDRGNPHDSEPDARLVPGRAFVTIAMTEQQTNIVWLEAVANICERESYFPVDAHDVPRLRELIAELKQSESRRKIIEEFDTANYELRQALRKNGKCKLCGCEVHPSSDICGECACEDDWI